MLTKKDNVEFLAYLELNSAPSAVIEFVSEEKKKGYESILLDREGQLKKGLLPGKSFLRIFSKKGNLIYKQYYTDMDNNVVDFLFSFVRKDR